MPIRIKDSADPLSEHALRGEREVIIARSEAVRVLRHELLRYCSGQIQGRSFLIAGHRGAGKTTMVADALHKVLQITRTTPAALRPLPIFLHGPSLLETLPTDLRRDAFSLEKVNGGAAKPKDDATAGAQNPATPATLTVGSPNSSEITPPDKAANDSSANKTSNDGANVPAMASADETQAQLALVHVILSLHRAVTKEFSARYREHILLRARATNATERALDEASELAAQFEIELMEDPPASRLREFWQRADALPGGILFAGTKDEDQGARELVAINGICNAHQRISGALSQADSNKRNFVETVDASRGFDVKAIDALKPFGAVFAGTAVAGGAVLSTSDVASSGLLGLATALLSSFLLKSTVTTNSRRERTLDRKFIPDLTPRTLDRVLPTLLDRLRNAGLAPVLIIDELDKVDDLATRIAGMIRYLKKLMAENVFSCFLTDRGYLEFLRVDQADKSHGRTSSYFSHRLLVGYWPKDLEAYLSQLMEAKDTPDEGASVDREVLKWVLRHRSQLHALSLAREIAAIRAEDGHVTIPLGQIRTDTQYRIDVTLQMAVELQLYSKDLIGWHQRQPHMQQTLFDAVYCLSRSWLSGADGIDLSPKGKNAFIEELCARMNVEEVSKYAPQAQDGRKQAKEDSASKPEVLGSADKEMLGKVLENMARFLSPANSIEAVLEGWHEMVTRLKVGPDVIPVKEVMSALLLGEQSLLEQPTNALPHLYRWRYTRSGSVRDAVQFGDHAGQLLLDQVAKARSHLQFVEAGLLSVLAFPDDRDIQVFSLLSDSWRVIDTSPAWTQVQAASGNLDLIERGVGNTAAFEKDCRIVLDFEKVVQSSEQTVSILVLASALISGLSLQGPRPLGIADAMSMLSSALGSAKLPTMTEVWSRTQALWRDLNKEYAKTKPLFAGEAVPATLATGNFASVVQTLVQAGQSWDVDFGEQEELAWRAFQRRLEQYELSGRQEPADLAEVICASRLVGPASTVGLDLERPLDAWTSILLSARMRHEERSVSTATSAAPSAMPSATPSIAPTIPGWLAAFVLRRLGAQSLQASAAQRVLELIGAGGQQLEPNLSARTSASSARSMPTSQGTIVIRNSQTSLTNTWIAPPTLGFALVVEATEAKVLAAASIMRAALPETALQLVWEEPAESDSVQSALLAALAKDLKTRLQNLYMYDGTKLPTKTPSIVEPSGADAIFKRAPSMPPP